MDRLRRFGRQDGARVPGIPEAGAGRGRPGVVPFRGAPPGGRSVSTKPPAPRSRSRLIRLAIFSTGLALAVVAVMVVPLWLRAVIPRWFVRGLAAGLLWSVAGAFLAGLTLAPLGAAAAFARLRRARRLGRPWGVAGRALMLCTSCVLGAVLLEAGAMGY